jgi:hypothetical protein
VGLKIEVYKDDCYVGKFKASRFTEKQIEEVAYLINTLKSENVDNVEYDYNGNHYIVEKIEKF